MKAKIVSLCDQHGNRSYAVWKMLDKKRTCGLLGVYRLKAQAVRAVKAL